MKLLFFPLFVISLVQCHFSDDKINFWSVKLIGISTGLISIPTIFYTYNGVFGKSPDIINIAIFIISAAIVFILETNLFTKFISKVPQIKNAFILICAIGILFIVFTFITPKIPLFQNPITGTYGI